MNGEQNGDPEAAAAAAAAEAERQRLQREADAADLVRQQQEAAAAELLRQQQLNENADNDAGANNDGDENEIRLADDANAPGGGLRGRQGNIPGNPGGANVVPELVLANAAVNRGRTANARGGARPRVDLTQEEIRRQGLLNATRVFKTDYDEDVSLVATRGTQGHQRHLRDNLDRNHPGLDDGQKDIMAGWGTVMEYTQRARGHRVVDVVRVDPAAANKTLGEYTLNPGSDTVPGMLGEDFANEVWANELEMVQTKQALVNKLLHVIPNTAPNTNKRQLLLDEINNSNLKNAIRDHDEKLLKKTKANLVREPLYHHTVTQSRTVDPPIFGPTDYCEDRALKEILVKCGGRQFDFVNPVNPLEYYLKRLRSSINGIYNEDVCYQMLQYILSGEALEFVEGECDDGQDFAQTWVMLQTLGGKAHDRGGAVAKINQILKTPPASLKRALLTLKTLVRKKNSDLEPEEQKRQCMIEIEVLTLAMIKKYFFFAYTLIADRFKAAKKEAKANKDPKWNAFATLGLLVDKHIGDDLDGDYANTGGEFVQRMKAYEAYPQIGDLCLGVGQSSEPQPASVGQAAVHAYQAQAAQGYNRPGNMDHGRPTPNLGRQEQQGSYGNRDGRYPNAAQGVQKPQSQPFNGRIPDFFNTPSPRCLLCASLTHLGRDCFRYKGEFPDVRKPQCPLCGGLHQSRCVNLPGQSKPRDQQAGLGSAQPAGPAPERQISGQAQRMAPMDIDTADQMVSWAQLGLGPYAQQDPLNPGGAQSDCDQIKGQFLDDDQRI